MNRKKALVAACCAAGTVFGIFGAYVVFIVAPVIDWPWSPFAARLATIVVYVSAVLIYHFSQSSRTTLHDQPAPRNRGVAIVLALFLGGIGAHHFYMGRLFLGFLYLAFVWTYVPAALGLAEAIYFAVINDARFQSHCR